jgi:hypothetical protein
MVGAFFDCEDNGNYALIQCQGSQCFCADAEGQHTGESVNAWEQHLLNCRPCDHVAALLSQQEQMPGMPHVLGMPHVVCDAAGFYEPIQCQGSV